MDFFRRLLVLPGFKDTDVCDIVCNPFKCTRCSFSSTSSVYNFSPPPPPPPPPPPSHESSPSPVLITIIAILSSFLLLATYYAVIAKLCSSRRISGVSPTQNDPTEHEDSSESTSIGITPANYVWYITTVGLDESVINSIAVCKYKRGESLVEGSNCSVCLNEFRDDDTLRLLPKCRHAFHIPCIDTWLRSHVNCPLCRTNIMSNPPSSFSTDPNADVSSALGRTQMGISQNNVGLGGDRNEQSMASEVEVDLEREGRLDLESLGRASSGVNNGMRILSDLGQVHRYGNREIEMVGDEMQPIRRSASMDSLASYMICLPFSNIPKNPGDKKQSLCESSGMKGMCCPSKFERNQRFVKVECKGYKWSSLSKVPIAMKRSNSGSAEFVLPRTSR